MSLYHWRIFLRLQRRLNSYFSCFGSINGNGTDRIGTVDFFYNGPANYTDPNSHIQYASWATTGKNYSDCSNQGSTAISTYTGYDKWGDPVTSVDGVAAANASLYSSAGCTLSNAPAYFPGSSWTGSSYTSCSAYDSISSLVTDSWNAFKQHNSTSYDATQGQLPTSVTNVNSQVTSTNYSYDSSGNVSASISQPGETGSYTSQATRRSTCTDSSTLPCMEIDSNTSQYSSAITRPIGQPSSFSAYYTVSYGDSLSAISLRYYGTYFQWQKIYQANRGVIGGNPNLIYPGERLVIPR